MSDSNQDPNGSAKYVVCPECLGEGFQGPGFVWTQDEVDQEDPVEFARLQADLRAGHFDTPCPTCQGRRVVEDLEVNDDGQVTTAEQRWADEVEYRAEVAAERRYGA